MPDRPAGEPTELIYLPEPSWAPVLLAFGLAALLAGLFTWWPYGVVGAVVALGALWSWLRSAREDFGRLPRRQHVTTAPIPAIPLRRPDTDA